MSRQFLRLSGAAPSFAEPQSLEESMIEWPILASCWQLSGPQLVLAGDAFGRTPGLLTRNDLAKSSEEQPVGGCLNTVVCVLSSRKGGAS